MNIILEMASAFCRDCFVVSQFLLRKNLGWLLAMTLEIMCLAYPGKIEKIKGDNAVVDFSGIKKETNISFVKVRKGDFVIVHAGFAIQKLTRENAFAALKIFN